LFAWAGPSRAQEELRAQARAEREADMAQRAAWAAANISSNPLRAEFELEVFLHDRDETGAFQATLGDIASLARRPRSDTAWDPGFREVQHRWNTDRWEYALFFHQHRLTAEGLESLKRQLGDG
jgi:hypothetical protein